MRTNQGAACPPRITHLGPAVHATHPLFSTPSVSGRPGSSRTRRAAASLIALGFSVLAGCSSISVENQGQRTERRVVDIEGETRSYVAFAPEGVGAEGAPVILLFHGAGGSAEGMLVGTDAHRIASELGAVLAIPEADHTNWAEDCGCINADLVHGTADTAFVTTLLADLRASWRVDSSRVWAIGFSQGGMFAQRLACQMSERFLGVAVLAATMSVPLAERCDPDRPVHLFIALSTDDPIFPWDGLDDGGFSALGGPETASLWQSLNGCDAQPIVTEEAGGVRYVYEGCNDGVGLELLGVDPGAHAWYMSARVDTSAEVWRFFGG